MPVRVNALEKLSHDVMRVQLQLPAHTAFQFHAGQYLEFILRDGSRRAYSMATPPMWRQTHPPLSCTFATCPAASSPTMCSVP